MCAFSVLLCLFGVILCPCEDFIALKSLRLLLSLTPVGQHLFLRESKPGVEDLRQNRLKLLNKFIYLQCKNRFTGEPGTPGEGGGR